MHEKFGESENPMFGWLKRKSRDGGRLAQLASASTQRRASHNKTCADDRNALLNHALGLATFFLEGGQLPTFLAVRNGFPPFGAGINPAGEVVDFNCLASPGNAGAFDVYCIPDQLAMFSDGKEEKLSPRSWHEPPPIEAVAQAMKQCAAAGGIHAAALVDGAEKQSGHRSAAASVIRVRLEHVEVDPVTWYLPYRISDQKLTRGELSQVPGRLLVFTDLGPARAGDSRPAPDIGSLVAMLQNDATRLDALSALARKGGEALPAVPHLIELLRDEDQLLVTKALKTLEAIGSPAKEAVPALVELASDQDYLIRLQARAALKVVSPAAAARFENAK
jgi:hypothetical protein